MPADKLRLYPNGLKELLERGTDNVTLRTRLVKSSYANDLRTPANFDAIKAHTTWADVSSHECDSGDYGGEVTPTNVAVSLSGDDTVLDSDARSYGDPVTITAAFEVVLIDTGGAESADILLGIMALNEDASDASSSAANFEVDWAAAGAFEITPNS